MSVPRPLARIVPKVAGKALGKKGMAFGTLITDWATIMGPELARSTLPQKLAFPPGQKEGATLHLKVSGSAALDVQHAEPQLIERINAFFGYRAVARIRLIQGPIPGAPRRPKVQRPMTPEEEAWNPACDQPHRGRGTARIAGPPRTRGLCQEYR